MAAEALVAALDGTSADVIAKAKAEREIGKRAEKWLKRSLEDDPNDTVA